MHRRGRVEQPSLGVEVGLHRRVEVEVVAGQVGETARGEADSVHPAELQGVAGHLHHRGVHAALGHHRQQGLQRGRLRCGQCAGHVGSGDADADGADQSRGALGRAQPRLDQVGRRRLAGGAGDAEDHHPVRRVAVDRGGELTEHRPGCGMDQHRHRRRVTELAMDDGHAVGVGEHRDGAALDGVGGETAHRAMDEPGSAANRSPGVASCPRRVTPVIRTSGTAPPWAGTAPMRAASVGSARAGVVRGRRTSVTPVTSINSRVARTAPPPTPSARSSCHPTEQRQVERVTVACRVSGGPGSGESGTFSRCSSQAAMLWNSGAAE